MSISSALRRSVYVVIALSMFLWLASVNAADLNPKAISITLPKDIKWTTSEGGNSQARLFGDPSKPEMYGVLVKWTPGHMSRPHFHPNDRYVLVVSGTWWVGTGPKYDPNSTVAVPAGSYVKHTAKEIHYDGAKDVECVLEIVGMGPATSTPAEAK